MTAAHVDSPTADAASMKIAIAVLLTAGFFLRLLFYTGPLGSDDISYFRFSQRLLLGQPFEDPEDHHGGPLGLHHGGRLAFIALIGIPAAWFEHVHFGAFANVLLFTARDAVVTLFAYRAIGGAPAAFAAAVLSLNPLSAVDASLMVPDGMTSFAMIAASIATYQALQRSDRWTYAWAFLSGVLTAIAYSAKDTGILVAVPTALGILYWCRGRTRLYAIVTYGLGFTFTVGVEMLAFWKLMGDPLFRVHALTDVHNQAMGASANLPEFARRVYWNLVRATHPLATSLPVLALFVPAVGVALFDRTRRLLFPVTALFLVLYLIFGSSSLTRLVPVPAQDRHLEPIVPYVALCLAMAGRLIPRLARRPAVVPVLLALSGGIAATAAPSVAYHAGDIAFSGLAKNAVIAIETATSRHPELPIYASADFLSTLEAFLEPEAYRRIKPYPESVPLPPGLYVMHPWRRAHRFRDHKIASEEIYRDLESMPVAAAVNLDHRVASFLKPPPSQRTVLGEVRVRTN